MKNNTLTLENILQENRVRKNRIFGNHNQITGEGMEGERTRVEIPDYDIPVQYLTKEVADTKLYMAVIDAGSVRALVESRHLKPDSATLDKFKTALHFLRCRHDPSFAFATAFKIKDKISGEMMPFKLNYAQRTLLREFEDMRKAGKPIKLILLKARQWGGSTLTQLYMAWIQLFLKQGWNSLIVAQTKDTARRIKAMYSKVLWHFPRRWFNTGQLKFSPSERSAADYVITDMTGNPVRNNVITVSSFENYESTRGSDIAMVHYSEVAYWITTLQKSADMLIRAVSGGIAEGVPLTLEVMESTANGKSGYFHDEYQEAKRGGSARKALFIPFFFIENDMMHFADEEKEKDFARWLLQNRKNTVTTAKTAESGAYLWGLWTKGATLEHIRWYVERRKSFHSHAQMASEAPSDDIECFTFSGKLMISPYVIAEMEKKWVKMPIWTGDIEHINKTFKLTENENGPMKIWEKPETGKFYDRYMVVVDVGGRDEHSDYSVITVVDRLKNLNHGQPLMNNWRDSLDTDEDRGLKVVARWRGHVRYDLMAWKAVAVAQYYDEAMLVFESNTFDHKRSDATQYVEEGDHTAGILNIIRNHYDNLYMRTSKQPDNVKGGTVTNIGFQTNHKTKLQMVDAFTVLFEDSKFIDPDERLYKELAIYEKRPNGSYGNIPGANNHDDIVMTDMIASLVHNHIQAPMPVDTAPKHHSSTNYHSFNESYF